LRSLRLSTEGRSGSSHLLALAALFGAAALSACGSHADNGVGAALIEDRGNLKAVRLITANPDSATSFQVLSIPVRVAADPTLLVSARPGYLARALLRFAPSNLPPPGSTVDSVTLVLPYTQGFGTSPFQVTAVRVTSAWVEAAVAADSFPSLDATLFGPVD